MIWRRPDNDEIADVLERVSDLLETQGADVFRIRAWRGAADSARALSDELTTVLASDGIPGLIRLPAIGKSISAAIQEYVETGHLTLLDRLEGEASAEDLFTTVPGVGEDLAHRIHEHLAIETLEDLEVAAHDGRLDGVPGFGPRRVQGVRDALATMLRSSGLRRARRAQHERAEADATRPDVSELLAVDAVYRHGAADGTLRRIAPRRFNPEGEAWLPMLHLERGEWAFTAMFSNTARAHALGTTRDWVLVWYEQDGREALCTVVTERRGLLAGRRVVRGRERECARHYESAALREPTNTDANARTTPSTHSNTTPGGSADDSAGGASEDGGSKSR